MEHKLDKTITLPEGWVCSDPDTHQYRKALTGEVYEFILEVTEFVENCYN